MRAKMRCSRVTHDTMNETIELFPVSDPVNKAWATATPGGQVTLTINNPDAKGHFKPGGFYYVDFFDAPEKDE